MVQPLHLHTDGLLTIPGVLISNAKTQRAKLILKINRADAEVTLAPEPSGGARYKSGPTFTDSADFHHLSPAPLLLLWKPTHDFGSNVWNYVLLSI